MANENKMEILLPTILPDDVKQNYGNLLPSCNVENVQAKAGVGMGNYNITAVIEPETACFSLKTATEIVNPIENVLIWPKQSVQMS